MGWAVSPDEETFEYYYACSIEECYLNEAVTVSGRHVRTSTRRYGVYMMELFEEMKGGK